VIISRGAICTSITQIAMGTIKRRWIEFDGKPPIFFRLCVALPVVNFLVFIALNYWYKFFFAKSGHSFPVCHDLSMPGRIIHAPALVCTYVHFAIALQILFTAMLVAMPFVYRGRVRILNASALHLYNSGDETKPAEHHEERSK
jgi:hypothetical protein